MKWNRKKLLAVLPAIAKQALIRDYDGDSADDIVAFFKSADKKGSTFEGLETESEQRAAYKMVTIEVDGDNVTVNGEAVSNAKAEVDDEDDLDDEETKAQDKENEENEELTKAYQVVRKAFGNQVPEHFGKVANAANGGPAIHTGTDRRSMKMYSAAAKSGGKFRGKKPVFADAETSQRFGAAVRVMASKGGSFKQYSQLGNDCAIIGTKAGSTTDNAFAASLIVHETSRDIIDNLVSNGAMREVMDIVGMPDGFYPTPRKTANMAMSYRNENGTYGNSEPKFDTVDLTAHSAGGIAMVSNELLNDSAFAIGDIVATSTIEGRNEFEDEEFFNGAYGSHGGLLGTCGANSDAIYDADNSSWADWTSDKLQSARGKVPAKAWKSGNVKLVCSTAFLQSVIYRWALSAGGNTGEQLLLGVTNGKLTWDGIPVVLCEVLPSVYKADQIVAYLGAFNMGAKVGVVKGSEELSSSAERYWELGQFAWKFEERIAFTYHDVTGTNSMVVALKD